jgi:HAD superfamily hydrolase (TIGR01458 family)
MSGELAVLIDIDGVLTVSWEPITGAAETMDRLGRDGVAYRLVTNTSSRSREEIVVLLGRAGIDVPFDHVLTAVDSAARHLAEHHPGARCLVVNDADLTAALPGVDVTTDPAHAEVVLLGGAGTETGYAALDGAFKAADRGVPVVALHRNTRYQTADGPALDMGAFIVGLEAATDVEVEVVGKPAAAFFGVALAQLGCDATSAVMVGDDITSDVVGAQEHGITGVLVRTGKFRPSDLDGGRGRPDHVIDDVTALPDLLASLRRP